jgi:hypothetical protein
MKIFEISPYEERLNEERLRQDLIMKTERLKG